MGLSPARKRTRKTGQSPLRGPDMGHPIGTLTLAAPSGSSVQAAYCNLAASLAEVLVSERRSGVLASVVQGTLGSAQGERYSLIKRIVAPVHLCTCACPPRQL